MFQFRRRNFDLHCPKRTEPYGLRCSGIVRFSTPDHDAEKIAFLCNYVSQSTTLTTTSIIYTLINYSNYEVWTPPPTTTTTHPFFFVLRTRSPTPHPSSTSLINIMWLPWALSPNSQSCVSPTFTVFVCECIMASSQSGPQRDIGWVGGVAGGGEGGWRLSLQFKMVLRLKQFQCSFDGRWPSLVLSRKIV